MITKTNVCDQIVEALIASIVDGRLKAGDKLPNERELSKIYGVSRVPLREALRSLSHMGIIETKHGIGTFIKEVNTTFFTNKLNSYLYLQEKPVIEVLQLRKLLEVESARLAAQNATAEDLEKLRIAEALAKDELIKLRDGQDSAFYDTDLRFHLAIAEASHNSLFVQFINSIHGTLHIHQQLSQKEPQPVDEVAVYHKKIRQAIEENDSDKAAEMMLNHIQRVEDLILAGIRKNKAGVTLI